VKPVKPKIKRDNKGNKNSKGNGGGNKLSPVTLEDDTFALPPTSISSSISVSRGKCKPKEESTSFFMGYLAAAPSSASSSSNYNCGSSTSLNHASLSCKKCDVMKQELEKVQANHNKSVTKLAVVAPALAKMMKLQAEHQTFAALNGRTALHNAILNYDIESLESMNIGTESDKEIIAAYGGKNGNKGTPEKFCISTSTFKEHARVLDYLTVVAKYNTLEAVGNIGKRGDWSKLMVRNITRENGLVSSECVERLGEWLRYASNRALLEDG
jgi:hypothetical protein